MTGEPHAKKHYRDDREVEMLAERFESCEIQPSEFDHPAHMTVALWYLSRFSATEATVLMRAGLHRFLSHHGIGNTKYNETMTDFWLKLIRSFQERMDANLSIAEIANRLIEAYGGNSKIIFDYYSRERVMSEEAKERWVEPDLRPLDF